MKLIAPMLPIIAWLVSSVLIILDWLAVRDLMLDLAIRATEIVPFQQQVESGFLHKWVIPAVEGFGALLCGVLAFVLVLAFEPLYRRAHDQGVLARRFGRVAAIQVVFFVVCRVLYIVLGFV